MTPSSSMLPRLAMKSSFPFLVCFWICYGYPAVDGLLHLKSCRIISHKLIRTSVSSSNIIIHQNNLKPLPNNNVKVPPLNIQLSNDDAPTTSPKAIMKDYIQMLRPVTILQAVGALVVGKLALSPTSAITTSPLPLILTALSVFLSYGSGMAMNDIADAGMDALHNDKRDRPVASGRISRLNGWTYCFLLCSVSLLLVHFASLSTTVTKSHVSPLVVWTVSNILVMLGYAVGLQKVFLLKNLLCGYLAISPLIGASILDGGITSSKKLYLLAAAGFPLQVSREILKDAEDIEIDRGTKKTLPLMIGVERSKGWAYKLVFADIAGMVLTPYYWRMFASKIPVYPVCVLVGFAMCFQASLKKSLSEGQRLLKKSIYILLAGMIGSLMLQ